jgi:hypothetical protein
LKLFFSTENYNFKDKEFNMNTTRSSTNHLIKRAVLAVSAAYALTFIHHVYGGLVDGDSNRLLVPVIMAVPLLLSLWLLFQYRRTNSGLALTAFSIVALLAWVLLLGLLHGGYAHLYKDILYLTGGSPQYYYPLNPNEHYPPDNIFFELTGDLDLVTAYFVALYTFRLIRDRQRGDERLQGLEKTASPG